MPCAKSLNQSYLKLKTFVKSGFSQAWGNSQLLGPIVSNLLGRSLRSGYQTFYGAIQFGIDIAVMMYKAYIVRQIP
jgi:hypothetical protein